MIENVVFFVIDVYSLFIFSKYRKQKVNRFYLIVLKDFAVFMNDVIDLFTFSKHKQK